MDSVDGIRVEADERGFELVLTGDFTEACARYLEGDGSELRLNMQAAAFEFAGSEGLRGLLEWRAEGDAVAAWYAGEPNVADEDGSDELAAGEDERYAADLARKAERERS